MQLAWWWGGGKDVSGIEMVVNLLCVQVAMDVTEALLNMADVFAELWPVDDTPRILLRILVHYRFAGGIRDSEAERCKIMLEFCDMILRENASRAVMRDAPLSFRQAKERWGDVVERYGSGGGGKPRGDGRQAGAVGAVGQPAAKGGAMARSRGARLMFGGRTYAVCFDYNRGSCNRRASGCVCEDAKGVVFAHACNFWFAGVGKHCLASHPRVGNH
jgi:hypothetical protein